MVTDLSSWLTIVLYYFVHISTTFSTTLVWVLSSFPPCQLLFQLVGKDTLKGIKVVGIITCRLSIFNVQLLICA